jgi:hypothetical protein
MEYTEITKFLTIFLLGLLFLNYLRKFLHVSQVRTNLIYFYHTIFMFLRYYYGENNPDDAPSYYLWATTDIFYEISIKSHFYLIYLVRFLNLTLGFNYIQICLIFNIIGSIGLIFLVSILQNIFYKNYTNTDRLIILFLILFPSLNFYTSSIGKDAIIITASSMFLYSILRINNRILLFIFSIVIITVIRPYVGFFIFFAFMIFYVLNIFKFHFILNSFILFFIALSFTFGSSTFLTEYNIKFNNIDFIYQFIESRQNSYQQSNTYTNLQEMFFLFRPISYLFRPFIFEVNNPLMLVAGLENLFLLFVFCYYILRINIKNIFNNKDLQFIFIFSTVFLIFLSNVTPVLGMAVRQKWMILIFMIYLLIALSKNSKNIKNNYL